MSIATSSPKVMRMIGAIPIEAISMRRGVGAEHIPDGIGGNIAGTD
jgi:hypothetical protein